MIQSTNQFSGEDIYFMKEILIPYKGQQIIQKPVESQEDRTKKHRELQIVLLAENIK